MKITVITWKDERWSANKKDLQEINELIQKNGRQINKNTRANLWKIFKCWVAKISNYRL